MWSMVGYLKTLTALFPTFVLAVPLNIKTFIAECTIREVVKGWHLHSLCNIQLPIRFRSSVDLLSLLWGCWSTTSCWTGSVVLFYSGYTRQLRYCCCLCLFRCYLSVEGVSDCCVAGVLGLRAKVEALCHLCSREMISYYLIYCIFRLLDLRLTVSFSSSILSFKILWY